jgi:hypothetical protein
MWIWLCFLILLMPIVVQAQQLKQGDRGLATEAQQEEEKKDFLRLRSDPKRWREFVAMTQMTLGRLGYGTGPFDGRMDDKTKQALRRYQEQNRLPQTGDLDMNSMKRVFEDAEALESVPISLSNYQFFDEVWDDYVSARGTWVLENDKQAFPLQTTRIHCNRQWNHCVEATAMVMLGHHLSVDIDYHEVERWDQHEIVTKPSEHLCARYTLRLSRSQKMVTGLRITTTTGKGCESIEKKDLTLRLVSGLEVYGELFKGHAVAVQHRMQMGDFEGFEFKE